MEYPSFDEQEGTPEEISGSPEAVETNTTPPPISQELESFIDLERRSKENGRKSPPPAQSVQELREVILNRIYIVASVLSVFFFLINSPRTIQNQQWGLEILYGLAMITIISLAFLRRISYTIRAGTLLLVPFVIGFSSFLSDGLYGNGRVFLVILPILASIFIGGRGRVIGLIVSVGAVAIIGLLMVSGVIEAPVLRPTLANDSPLAWTAAVGVIMLIAGAVTTAIHILVTGLETSIFRQQLQTKATERERLQSERRVEFGLRDLDRRLVQMRTVAEITRTISSQLDINILLPQVCDLVRKDFDLYYVGVFLVEEKLEVVGGLKMEAAYAVLAAGTGEAGQKMLADQHKLAIGGDSMIGSATANRQARIALDVGEEAVHFSNPHLPETRSELALPIVVQDQALGAITIQSERAEAFDENDIIVLQGIADNLGSAIENARLFSEVQENLDEIQSLHHQYLESAWGDVLGAQEKLAYSYQSPSPSIGSPSRTLQVPIKLREQVIGNLRLETDSLDSEAPDNWSPEEMALIEAVAAQTALSLENVRLLEETQQYAKQERIQTNISGKVWASSDIDTILRTALQELGSSLQASEGFIELEVNE